MRHLSKIVLLGMAAACIAGCEPNQTIKNIWKDTKAYYREYLNTPAVLEMHDTGDYKDYMLHLGAGMAALDTPLNQLLRVMDDSDRGPDNAWAMAQLRRFPWLSGLAVIDGEGNELARVPDYSLKDFDATLLLEADPKQRRSELRAYVQQSGLGPEIYVGKPVYMGDELKALVVAHFDMRALLAHNRGAAHLVIATPQVMLWPGLYDIEQTPLVGVDWEKTVLGNSSGTLSNSHGSFQWVSSYFANLPIIYAIASSGDFSTSTEQLEMLDYADAFAVPNINIAPPAPQDDSSLGEFLDE